MVSGMYPTIPGIITGVTIDAAPADSSRLDSYNNERLIIRYEAPKWK